MAHTRYTRKPPREVEAAAGMWEHGLAPKEGGLSLVQCPSTRHRATTTGAVRGARARQARMRRLLPRERQRNGAQARCPRKPPHEFYAAAGTWEHGLAPKKGGFSLVLCPSIGRLATAAGAVRGARTWQPRVLRLLSKERQRSGAQARYTRKPVREVDAAAGTWEHSFAPKKGGLSLVQCHFTCYGVTTAGAVRGARARQARDLRLLPRDRQRDGAHALHAQTASRSGGRSWHVGARPCTEGGRSLAGAVPFHKA